MTQKEPGNRYFSRKGACGIIKPMKIEAFSVLLGVALLTITACNPETFPASGPGAEKTAQVLRRGNGGDPESLDPALAQDVHAFSVLIDLYEGLVAEAADGSLIPGVAESWTTSEDGVSYTFKLRPDARWSNGHSVTAGHFVSAFRRVASPDTASAYAFLLESVENFAQVKGGELQVQKLGVRATDEETLIIQLSAPSAHFLGILAMPIAFPVYGGDPSKSQFSEVDDFVGNGAYVLSERRIDGPIRLRRNQHYWDSESVAIESIEYHPIVDNVAELNRYRANELDITATVPSSHFDTIARSLPDELRVVPSLAFYYLAFDLTEAPLNDKSLRQALSMAIDREQLVKLIGRGEQPAYSIVPPGVANHVGATYEWRDLNREEREKQARRYYENAGYGTDQPLEMKLTYDTGDIHERVALAVSSMWNDVLGADVKLEKKEWRYFLETRDKRNDWQIMRFSWIGDYNDATTFADIFRSDSAQNLPQYHSSLYNEALDRAATELDRSARISLLTEAESLLINDYPIAPLYFYVSKHMVKPYISGFENNILDRHPSRFLSFESANRDQHNK